MWRSLSKQPSLRKLKPSITAFGAVKPSQDSIFSEGIVHFLRQSSVCRGESELGLLRGAIFRRKHDVGPSSYAFRSDPFRVSGNTRGYAAAAEAVVSSSEEEASVSTCEEEADAIQELVEKFNKENASILDSNQNQQNQNQNQNQKRRQHPKTMGGMATGKYNALRRRQIKVETEAWEEAAREYQELLTDMCDQKLAPNLPYVKTLFLGWFEPLRDAIAAEQELCRDVKSRSLTHAPYFDQLSADMMAVITMHKLMALLMTGGGRHGVRVIQAAGEVGEAIEHEVGLNNRNYCDHIYLFWWHPLVFLGYCVCLIVSLRCRFFCSLLRSSQMFLFI